MTPPSPLRGMLLGAAGYFSFTCADALVRAVKSGGYPPWQLAFVLSLASLGVLLLPVVTRWQWRRLATRRPGFHLLRSSANLIALLCAMYAVTHIPLAEFYGIVFLVPLLVTIGTAVLLGESVGRAAWVSVALGLVGVAIALQPWQLLGDASVLGWGHGVALAGVFAGTVNVLVTRQRGGGETALSLPVYYFILSIIVTGVMTQIGGVVVVQSDHLWLMLLAGVLQGLANLAVMRAYQTTSPPYVAPTQYTQLFWGVIISLWAWGEAPVWTTVLGAALVMLAGGALFWQQVTMLRRNRKV